MHIIIVGKTRENRREGRAINVRAVAFCCACRISIRCRRPGSRSLRSGAPFRPCSCRSSPPWPNRCCGCPAWSSRTPFCPFPRTRFRRRSRSTLGFLGLRTCWPTTHTHNILGIARFSCRSGGNVVHSALCKTHLMAGVFSFVFRQKRLRS